MKPILFSTKMVQAILAGNKTQTRRIVKPQPSDEFINPVFGVCTDSLNKKNIGKGFWQNEVRFDSLRPVTIKYEKGNILWVRETFAIKPPIDPAQDWTTYLYKTDSVLGYDLKWKPSIFMPREACRLFLEVTYIRVEKLQDISEQDASKEGLQDWYGKNAPYHTNKERYSDLWESINGKGSWEKNPYVWVIEFKKIDKPVNN